MSNKKLLQRGCSGLNQF